MVLPLLSKSSVSSLKYINVIILNAHIIKEEEKLPEISLHGLRHTSATLMISQNVDIRTVSNRLGHAQTSTTLDIYSHALQKMDEQASSALDTLLNHKISS